MSVLNMSVRLIKLTTECLQRNSQNSLIVRRLTSHHGYNFVKNHLTYKTDSSPHQSLPALQFVRNYAKGKDKKKEKGKTKVQVNETQLGEIIDVDGLRSEMHRCVEMLKEEFTKNLSLRTAAGSIESILVNVDGKDHTLQELAQIVRKNPKTIVVNMAVFPQAIPAALKAIQKSGMNLNPQQDGTTLYIPVPKITREYREQLSKSAKQFFVKCKDNIKDKQNKQIKLLKRKEHTSEDIIRSIEGQVVALADEYITEAQKILDSKQSELVGKE